MNFYSEILPLLLILAAPVVAGCFAWSRRARKTACGLWGLAVWLIVGQWLSTRITPADRLLVQKHSCINNLKAIDSAVQEWAPDHGKQASNTYTLSDPALLAYLKGSVLPTCPGGGHYSPGTMVSDSPKCSLATKGHTL